MPDQGLVMPDQGLVIPDQGLVIPDQGLVIPDLIRDPLPRGKWIAGRGPQ